MVRVTCAGVMVVVFLSAGLAGASTYYVDQAHPSASNSNPGTEDLPWLTLSKAASTVTAGDTVYVKAGTYTETLTITANGAPGSEIVFRNFGTDHVTIDAEGTRNHAIFIGSESTFTMGGYVTVDGFEITGAALSGVLMVHTQYSTLRNLKVHDSVRNGIRLKGQNWYSTIQYCESYENTQAGIACYSTGGTLKGNPKNVTIDNCYAHDNYGDNEGADGIAFARSGMGMGGQHRITNCIAHDNADDGFDACEVDNVWIENNISFQNGDIVNIPPGNPGDGDGNGIKVSTCGGGNHTVLYNVAFNNERGALDQDISTNAPHNYFYNNTCYGQRYGLVLDTGAGGPDTAAYVFNNVLSDQHYTDYWYGPSEYGTIAVSDYNLVKDGNVVTGRPINEGPHTLLFIDPQFLNPPPARTSSYEPIQDLIDTTPQGSLVATMDYIRAQVRGMFKPGPSSLVIDAGTTVPGIHCPRADDDPANPMDPNASGRHWYGLAPDIGAYEFVPPVKGRYVFYNNSTFDGDDPAANASDDAAIATDKTALLPGGTATFANYTSYSRGINGVMVDIDSLGGTPTASDFTFKVGNDSNPAGWSAAPAASSITLRPGAGAGGGDRITIIWADNAIQKQWVQVTVLATANTGLGAADVFYFGNAIGETGNSPIDANVTPTDEVAVQNSPHTLANNPAAIDDVCDLNHDRKVGPTDAVICRNNGTSGPTALQLITVP